MGEAGGGEACIDRRLKRGFSACPPGKCAGETRERKGGGGTEVFGAGAVDVDAGGGGGAC